MSRVTTSIAVQIHKDSPWGRINTSPYHPLTLPLWARKSARMIEVVQIAVLVGKAEPAIGQFWTFLRKGPLKIGGRASWAHHCLGPALFKGKRAHSVAAHTL